MKIFPLEFYQEDYQYVKQVSRTIGDIEAKLPKFNGLENVIIATPEISQFKITFQHDFLVLGCDGIFDNLSSKDLVNHAFIHIKEFNENNNIDSKNIHSLCSEIAELILKASICKRTYDNISVILIFFKSKFLLEYKDNSFERKNSIQETHLESNNQIKKIENSNLNENEKYLTRNKMINTQNKFCLTSEVLNKRKDSEMLIPKELKKLNLDHKFSLKHHQINEIKKLNLEIQESVF